jgi:hypothetical protein
MRPCSVLLAVLPCLLLAASPCLAQGASPQQQFEETGVASHHNTPFDAPERQVIRNAEQWEAVWKRIWGGGAAPKVDFSRHMVLLAAVGNPPYSRSIHITNVVQRKDTLDVTVHTNEGCAVCTVITYPVTLMRVGRTQTSVRFIEMKGK